MTLLKRFLDLTRAIEKCKSYTLDWTSAELKSQATTRLLFGLWSSTETTDYAGNTTNSQTRALCKAGWTISHVLPPSRCSLPATRQQIHALLPRAPLKKYTAHSVHSSIWKQNPSEDANAGPGASPCSPCTGSSLRVPAAAAITDLILRLLITRAPPAVRPRSAPQHIPSASQSILNLDYLHSGSAVPVSTV